MESSTKFLFVLQLLCKQKCKEKNIAVTCPKSNYPFLHFSLYNTLCDQFNIWTRYCASRTLLSLFMFPPAHCWIQATVLFFHKMHTAACLDAENLDKNLYSFPTSAIMPLLTHNLQGASIMGKLGQINPQSNKQMQQWKL